MNAEQAAKILGITILSFRSLVVNKNLPRTGMVGGTGKKGGYSVDYDKKIIIDMAHKKAAKLLKKASGIELAIFEFSRAEKKND